MHACIKADKSGWTCVAYRRGRTFLDFALVQRWIIYRAINSISCHHHIKPFRLTFKGGHLLVEIQDEWMHNALRGRLAVRMRILT